MSGGPPLPSLGRAEDRPDAGAPAVRPGWFLAAWAGLTLANMILAVGVQPPARAWTWAAEVLAALFVSLAETLVIARLALEVMEAIRAWWERAAPLPRRIMAATVAVLVAVPVTGTVGGGVLAVRSWLGTELAQCTDPATVTVLTNADFRASVTAAARAFERETADEGCPSATVHVTETDRAQARAALRQGWSDAAHQAIGPRPDLWIADRAVDLAATAQLPQPVASALGSATVVAHSPVMLATAGAAGQPGPMSWRDTVERMRRLGRPVVRPEPSASAVGELALLHDYPDDLSGPGNGIDHTAQRYEAGYAASFSQTGWRRADVPALLRDAAPALCGSAASALRQAVLVLPAFLTTAAARPVGSQQTGGLGAGIAGCPAGQWPALEIFQTAGEPVNVELAVARLQWPDSSQTGAAADRFRDWLGGEAGRALLTRIGWRSGPAGRGTDERAAAAALDRYQAARTTARLVVGVDASVSMQALRPEITAVVTTLVDQLGPADQVGLFGFVRSPRGADVLTPAVDLAAARDARGAPTGIARVRRWLENHSLTDGGTPLGVALTRGTAAMPVASRPESARDTLLVITDGQDLVDPPVWDELAQRAAASSQQIFVLIVGDRSDLTADLPTGNRVHLVHLTGDAPGQQALRATTAFLWRAEG